MCGRTFTVPRSSKKEFCSRKCGWDIRSGIHHHRHRRNPTGRYVTKHPGYAWVKLPSGRWRQEHRVVVERHLGRRLQTEEHVHHKDENKVNNTLPNLQVVWSGDHGRLHKGRSRLNGRWSFKHRCCVECGRTRYKHTGRGICQRCRFRKLEQRRRQAEKLAALDSDTRHDWEAMCARYGHRCLRCGASEPDIVLTIDHVIPLSRRGVGNIGNLQPLCFTCNRRKWTRVIDYRLGTFARILIREAQRSAASTAS
jgi:5-methylcytosine-specific restriction endonuclease McrA